MSSNSSQTLSKCPSFSEYQNAFEQPDHYYPLKQQHQDTYPFQFQQQPFPQSFQQHQHKQQYQSNPINKQTNVPMIPPSLTNNEGKSKVPTHQISCISEKKQKEKSKGKMIKTKEEMKLMQNEQKMKQKQSIILRAIVFMRLLANNFKYTFIIGKNKRQSVKGLQYYPILKIYNQKGENIFDIDTVSMSTGEKKIRYCQVYVIELMREELEHLGYCFKKKQTKKASKVRDGNSPVTLTKVNYMMKVNDCRRFSMKEMEERIGYDGYNTLVDLFKGKATQFVYGQTDIMDSLHTYLLESRIIDSSTEFIREGNTNLLEVVYFGEFQPMYRPLFQMIPKDYTDGETIDTATEITWLTATESASIQSYIQ